jgi:hypothetical protein
MSIENPTQSKDEITKVDQHPKIKKHRFPGYIREFLAILFWFYIVTKLFVFDLDILLIEKLAPNYLWIIYYKFFFLIGIIAIVFLVTKNLHIILWSLFIFFYPLILILWRIPALILKQRSWNLIIAFLDSTISFFKAPKLRFAKLSFFLISMAIILGASNKFILWSSIIAITIIILLVYIQRSILIFKPSGINQIYLKVFSFLGDVFKHNPPPSSCVDMKDLSDEKIIEMKDEAWISRIQQLVFVNRICLFCAKKIKSYQKSKFNIISNVFGVLILIFFTVISFTLINYGLYKLDPEYFTFSKNPTFFIFIYYSFNNLLFNSIQEVVASSQISQIYSMYESFSALFLILIFVALVLSVKSQKEEDEMDTLIKGLSDEGSEIEDFIKHNYQFTNIEEAIQALKKLKVAFIDILLEMTESAE